MWSGLPLSPRKITSRLPQRTARKKIPGAVRLAERREWGPFHPPPQRKKAPRSGEGGARKCSALGRLGKRKETAVCRLGGPPLPKRRHEHAEPVALGLLDQGPMPTLRPAPPAAAETKAPRRSTSFLESRRAPVPLPSRQRALDFLHVETANVLERLLQRALKAEVDEPACLSTRSKRPTPL